VVEQRAEAFQESQESSQPASPARVRPASYPGNQISASDGQRQLPPPGGVSPEIVVSRAQGLSLFASAGAFALNHHNNSFEDGYQAMLPTVTIGADYQVTPWLLAGVAFNYTNSNATYDDGGGFDKNIFAPVLYATYLPFDGAFVNASLGYARSENSNNRKAVVPSAGGPGEVTSVGVSHTSADYPENLYSAGLQMGYDHPVGSFKIGPRLGLGFGYSQVDSFEENGSTGLELRYSGLDQISVQSSLGAAASVAIAMPGGKDDKLWPQVSAAWVHEYANDARNVDARYINAPNSPTFTFQRERPARNWANIGVGVSASLKNGHLWPFAQFTTVQGNENFVSYGGTAGLRVSF
jgi:outer membrane lipase/esterase